MAIKNEERDDGDIYLDPNANATSDSIESDEDTIFKPLAYDMNVNRESYGDSLYMDEKTVAEAIEIVTQLASDLFQIFQELKNCENDLAITGNNSGWWSYASEYDYFDHTKLLTSSAGDANGLYPGDKLLNIRNSGSLGIDGYVSNPSFAGLVSAIEEIRDAIINYSNGVDVNSAKASLFTWVKSSGCDPSKFAPSSLYNAGITNPDTEATDVVAPVTPVTPVEIPVSSDIMDSDVIDFDDIDGADNIQIKDSITDDILDISSDDLMKDSSSKGIPGIASIIGASTVSGGLTGAGIGAGSLGITGSDTLESLGDSIDLVDTDSEDLSDLSSSVTGTISSFVAPDVNMAAKGKTKSSSAGVAAALAGIGTLSAGGIGGKIYLDKKKKKDEDDEENDDEEFEFQDDDFLNENDEGAQSVVDFKNDILSEDE